MNLNGYIISKKLSGVVSHSFHSSPLSAELNNVRLFKEGKTLNSHCIYVIDEQEIINFQPVDIPLTIVCRGDAPQRLKEHPNYDIICCKKSFSLEMILEKILWLFEQYREWERNLMDALLGGKSITDLCNLSISIFKNPIMVMGTHLNLNGIGENAEYSITYDVKNEDSDFMSDNLILDLTSNPKFAETYIYTTPQFYYDSPNDLICIYINIFVENHFAARIIIDSLYTEMNECDFMALSTLAKYIKNYLIMHSSSEFSTLIIMKNQIQTYIKEEDSNKLGTLFKILKRINWFEQGHYQCTLFETENPIIISQGWQYQSNILENKFPGAITVTIDQNLLMIYSWDCMIISQNEYHQRLSEHVREHIMRCGCSEEFTQFKDLISFYKQARTALEVGKEKEPTKWIYEFHKYAIATILRQGIYCLPREAIIPQSIQNMIRYDKEHQTEYFNTFKTYVKSHYNQTITTKELFIHPSTFKYRLKKIKEMMETEKFDNPDLTLYYMMIFKLLEESP